MKRILQAILVGCLFLLSNMALLGQAPNEMYATGDDGTTLVVVDINNASTTTIGSFGFNQTWATAFTPDGVLWTIVNGFSGFNTTLATVDINTGAATTVGSGWGFTSICLDADLSGQLYAVGYSNGNLYSVDRTTGVPTLIGNTGIFNMMDIAFDSQGTLWAINATGRLWTLDVNTGASTLISNLSPNINAEMTLCIDDNDNFFVGEYVSTPEFFSLDPLTGVGTLIGVVGTPFLHGGDIYTVACQSTLFFSQDNNGTGLYSLNTSTGEATMVGASGVTSSTVGLAPNPDRTELYGSTFTDLVEISTDGSGFTTVGSSPAEGLAYDADNDVLYSIINGSFKTIDQANGSTLSSLASPPGGADIEGLAYAGNGTIYGLAGFSGPRGNLYSYDIGSDTWTTIGYTGIDFNLCGMAYDFGTGMLYAIGSQDNNLYRIDPAVGTAVLVGPTGMQATGGGLAFGNTQPNISVARNTFRICSGEAIDYTISSTESGSTTFDPWINEFHYDNSGGDVGEFVEVAGSAGTDLSGYEVVLYNGSNGLEYSTISLTGTIDDEGDCIGALSFLESGIQNGAPDGLALVDPSGNVLEFLSYEGTFTADDGPANGMMSTDVGVSEGSGTPVGFSLQQVGTGQSGPDFTWLDPADDSPGDLNAGQTIDPSACGGGGVLFDLEIFDYINAGTPEDMNDDNAFPIVYTDLLVSDGNPLNTLDLIPLPAILNETGGFDAGAVNIRLTNIRLASNPSCTRPDFQDDGIRTRVYPEPVLAPIETVGVCPGEDLEVDVDMLKLPSQNPANAGFPVKIDWTVSPNPNVSGAVDGMIEIYDVNGDESQINDIVQTLTNLSSTVQTVTYTVFPTSDVRGGFGNLEDCVGEAITFDVVVGIEPEMDAEINGMSIADPNGPVEVCEGEINDGTGDQSISDVQFDLTSMTMPNGMGVTVDPWINELHYDNSGGDVGEFFEIAGSAGTDLAGYSVVLYNGNGGAPYNTIALTGVIDNEGECIGALEFFVSGIQNGSPDGLALVDPADNVLEFISYEGTFTANGGPADGMMSTDIGVDEPGSTPIGESLQKTGTGQSGGDFTWQDPAPESPGSLNAGQTISPTTCASGDAELQFILRSAIVVSDPNVPSAGVSTALRDGGVGQSWIPAMSPELFEDDITIANTMNLTQPVTITYTFFPRLRITEDPDTFCDGEDITVTVQINPSMVAISCPADVDYGTQCNVTIPPAETEFNLNTPTNPDLPTVTTMCSGDLTLSSFLDTMDMGCQRTITRSYVITDASNGADTCEQNFTFIFDTTRPELSMYPADTTVDCRFVPDAPEITPSDNCQGCEGAMVSIIAAADDARRFDAQAKINATGLFGVVDVFDARNATPDLSYLQGYDAVLIFSNNGFDDADLLGDNLADYVDMGGGVVTTVFANASIEIMGRFDSDNYWCLEPLGQASGSSMTLGAIYEPMSPLLDGVNSFNGGSSSFHSTGMVNANAIRVADYNNGDPLIIRRTINGVERVDLNMYPPSDDVRSDFWLTSTDGDLLMANALSYVAGCTSGGGSAAMVTPWINEFHYDNSGGDVGEFIEVAGSAGFDLTGWSLVLYNGNGGSPYRTINMAVTIDDEGDCIGAVDFQLPTNGIQNGSPDGIALVDDMGNVIEFISYEGTFTANGGPADGMTSVDVGVSESSGTPVGFSLQKVGTGQMGGDFMWIGPADDSPGDLNTGQMIDPSACAAGGLEVTFEETLTPGNCPNEYTITRTWSTEDACGNDTMHTQMIEVIDTTPPIVCTPIPFPMDTTIDCTMEMIPIDTVTGIDECDTTLRGIVWINEIHYDNFGIDNMEFVELAGFNGTDLQGWRLVLYNGATTIVYNDMMLTGIFTNQSCGYGFIQFDYPSNGIQNGSPDGVALVDADGNVVQFLSYEGTFTASDGPAAGMTSIDIMVSEPGQPGESLQLSGSGNSYDDFTWMPPMMQTPSAINNEQTIEGNIVSIPTDMTVPGICPVVDTTFRMWTLTDACGNDTTLMQTIVRIDTTPPTALCQNVTVILDDWNKAEVTPEDIDNGSFDTCDDNPLLSLDRTLFRCADLGDNDVVLTVTDDCGNASTCAAVVTVLDTTRPTLTCVPVTLQAGPGDCELLIEDVTILTDGYDNCTYPIVIREVPGGDYGSWDYWPLGTHEVWLVAEDESGNVSDTCRLQVTIEPFENPVTALFCNDYIQFSLDETCMTTLTADMILEGGPYTCYELYEVLVEDDRGNVQDLDDDPSNGTQLGWEHIGRCFKVTVRDQFNTNNRCWGTVCIQDKMRPMIEDCMAVTVDCGEDTDPLCFGGDIPCPVVFDNCDPILEASYVDWETLGSCEAGYDRIISRRWTFTDDWGNVNTCEQVITVGLGDLFSVAVPGDYDDVSNPALLCDEKYDENKDVSPHILDFPFCVDGYLLDSAVWFATGGDPTITNPDARDLSGDRLPMTLGWNCMDQGKYIGHPSPSTIYYDPHPQWEFFGVCWGPNEVVKWTGTGYPSPADCGNIQYTYRDTKIDLSDPDCNAGAVGCFKILRQWTVIDWCSGDVGGHDQIIKILDKEGPQIVMPDELEVGTDVWKCEGVVPIPAPWISDNCSEDVDYNLVIKTGQVTGNSQDGYTVVGLELGEHTLYIQAFDCCGNRSVDSITLNVVDNTPPVAVCEDRVQLSLTGNQSPGSNFSSICAEDLDQSSYDNCTDWLWFKMIRMDELLGTVNGSFANNTMACGGVNGDDDAIISGNQVYFDDCSKFCCEDADQIVMVVLRVHDMDPGAGPVSPARYASPAGDLVGRFTDCWVEIEVVDKAQPIVVAPPDMVVSCMFWFDDSEDALSDPSNATFGRVVTSLNAREKVKTIDVVCEQWCEDHPKYDYEPSRNTPVIWSQACDFYNSYYDAAHPDDKYELVWGFDGYAIRTCGAMPEIRVDDRRECGQGVILRDVIVSYQDPKTGGVVSFRDRQEIWVIDCDPFYVNTDDCFDDEDCIQWPLFCQQPDPLDGCGADLDPYTNPQLGAPVIENGCDDNCALVAVDYVDEIYTIEPDACFKVIRTWIIIDWCQYDPLAPKEYDGDNPNTVTEGRWEYVQSIAVRDKIDPVITTEVGDCEPAEYVDSLGTCVSHIEICAEATDDCSPDSWIVYDYKIDAFSDGVGQFGDFDFYVGKLTRRQDSLGQNLTQGPLDCEAYNQGGYCNPFADDPTQPFCASGTYPLGTHTIYWFAEDGCGNVTKDTTVFDVLDCKQPTPYCKPGIITVVMPSTQSIDIWASDLDDGSFDNCTAQEDLIFSFSADTSETSMTFDCDDLGTIGVEIWVTDEEGNQDFCLTFVRIQDNNDVCGNTVQGDISGLLTTSDDDPIAEAEVSLNKDNAFMKAFMTDNSGQYVFKAIDMYNDYTVEVHKNNDILNGVSTKDLVMIQRHLLGKEPLITPYQHIAADVTNNENISAADLSALRKVILGNESDFTSWAGQTSWRFIDSEQQFADPTYPWPLNEMLSYPDMSSNQDQANFVGVKVGDVSGDVKPNGLTGSQTRSSETLNFIIDNEAIDADEISVPFKASAFEGITGFQFTIQIDPAMVQLIGVESGVLGINEGNLGLTRIDEGFIAVSWNSIDGQPLTVENNVELFSLNLDVAQAQSTGELIRLSSVMTRAEAYNADLDELNLNLEFRQDGQFVEVFDLYQNVPNPFETETVIGFVLPKEMTAVVTIYDVSGKVLWVENVDGKKGLNELSVQSDKLNGSGVMYYQLDAEDHTATKRMVVIK